VRSLTVATFCLDHNIKAGPHNTHEDRARSMAEREVNYGTAREWALMQENGSKAIIIEQSLPDGHTAMELR
jgi:hypothetical protein